MITKIAYTAANEEAARTGNSKYIYSYNSGTHLYLTADDAEDEARIQAKADLTAKKCVADDQYDVYELESDCDYILVQIKAGDVVELNEEKSRVLV